MVGVERVRFGQPQSSVAANLQPPPGYDNAGQMTGATLPDGTALGYSYDAAHRLTGVTDAKGNTVTYTLDNMGNRAGEQVKAPRAPCKEASPASMTP